MFRLWILFSIFTRFDSISFNYSSVSHYFLIFFISISTYLFLSSRSMYFFWGAREIDIRFLWVSIMHGRTIDFCLVCPITNPVNRSTIVSCLPYLWRWRWAEHRLGASKLASMPPFFQEDAHACSWVDGRFRFAICFLLSLKEFNLPAHYWRALLKTVDEGAVMRIALRMEMRQAEIIALPPCVEGCVSSWTNHGSAAWRLYGLEAST